MLKQRLQKLGIDKKRYGEAICLVCSAGEAGGVLYKIDCSGCDEMYIYKPAMYIHVVVYNTQMHQIDLRPSCLFRPDVSGPFAPTSNVLFYFSSIFFQIKIDFRFEN